MSTLERLSILLARKYKLDPTSLSPDRPLTELGIDSLGMVEMVFFIEDEFKIRLPADAAQFTTIHDAVRCIDELLAAGPAAAAGPDPAPTAADSSHPIA